MGYRKKVSNVSLHFRLFKVIFFLNCDKNVLVTGKKETFTFNQTIFLPFFGRTKTCSLKFLKNSREISLHDLDLESFLFYPSEKSESQNFSLFTSQVKD